MFCGDGIKTELKALFISCPDIGFPTSSDDLLLTALLWKTDLET